MTTSNYLMNYGGASCLPGPGMPKTRVFTNKSPFLVLSTTEGAILESERTPLLAVAVGGAEICSTGAHEQRE